MKERIIIEIRKLSVNDSIINSIPCLLSCILWLIISITGFQGISTYFVDYIIWMPIALILWIMIMLALANRLIITPITTYNVVKKWEEK